MFIYNIVYISKVKLELTRLKLCDFWLRAELAEKIGGSQNNIKIFNMLMSNYGKHNMGMMKMTFSFSPSGSFISFLTKFFNGDGMRKGL